MRRRDTDAARWAAAASIARGRESPDARRFRRRAQWLSGSLVVLGLAALVLIVARTPLEAQLFPPRGAGRTPAGWQIVLAVTGLVGSGLAFLRWRVLSQEAEVGNWLPPLDPRTVLRAGQRRAVDRWIRAGATPSDQVPVVFDRAMRMRTFPSPFWPLLMLPASFTGLTWSFRGPLAYLVAGWLGWAVAVLITWWWGRRLREAAATYVDTAGMVGGPVTDPAPGR